MTWFRRIKCGALGVVIALAGGFLSAAEPAAASALADAKAAAAHLGEYVKFQDIVTAISKSRSKDGYYMSFGAPFPDQVLSVWVTRAVFEKLPVAYPLIGRTVRIEGWLKKSSTGPMLDLDAPAQYQLLTADERVLAKDQLDGHADRAQFTTSVQQYLARGDFKTVEELGVELTGTRERFGDGTWLLDAYYDAFRLSANASAEAFAQREELLARWQESYPGSAIVPIVRVGFFLDQAAQVKYTRRAKTHPATPEHIQPLVAAARRTLESAPAASRSSPRYDYYLLQTIPWEEPPLGPAPDLADLKSMRMEDFAAMRKKIANHREQWLAKRAPFFQAFTAATERTPDYFADYFFAAARLLPVYGGQPGDWENFAEQQRVRIGGEDGDALYARIVWALCETDRNFPASTKVSWPTAARGFEVLGRQYPDSPAVRSIYAKLAFRAGDRTRLKAALALMKEPDMTIWVNLENVGFAEKFANSSAPAAESGAPVAK